MTRREERLVLHASFTNFYWVLITICVLGLVTLPQAVLAIESESGLQAALIVGCLASVCLVGMLAYCQKKARWLVAAPRGLDITERRGTRCVPWADVRVILDLGRLGAGPGAKRYYIEFADGDAFTFLGDTDAMDRLDALRERWRQQRTNA